MRATFIVHLVALLFSAILDAQPIIIGDAVTQKDVTNAKAVLAASEPKILNLEVGEFEIVVPGDKVKGPLLWLSTDDELLTRIDVPAGQGFTSWMKRRGEAEAKLHQFPARPQNWAILVGTKAGSAALVIVVNGETPDVPPLVIDRVQVQVGPRPPPGPGPGPAPIPAQGLHVLIIQETGDRLPPEQAVIMTSKLLRDRLASLNAKFRVWDKDVDASKDDAVFREALKRPRNALPWIVITNGTKGYEGPLPNNVAETIALIERFK